MTPLESVAIRRAVDADSAALTRVQALSARQAGISASLLDWQELFRAPGFFTYLCEAEQVFGFVTTSPPSESYFDDGETGEILALYLDPVAWGQGYGRKLLVHGLSVAKRRQCETAMIWLPNGSDRAEAIARSLGFEAAGSTRETLVSDARRQETAYTLSLSRYF